MGTFFFSQLSHFRCATRKFFASFSLLGKTEKLIMNVFVLSAAIALLILALPCPAQAAYNISLTMDWLNSRGCRNATITNCPGNQLCTDAEYFARALAAGKVIPLDPNTHTQAGYNDFDGFNLCLSNEFEQFLTSKLGWTAVTDGSFPEGAIVVTHEWSMPMIAIGNGKCTSHTPVVAGGPHCGMPCPYFNVAAVYFPSSSAKRAVAHIV